MTQQQIKEQIEKAANQATHSVIARDKPIMSDKVRSNAKKWFERGLVEAIEHPELYNLISLEKYENELWLPIPGFEGKYEASNLGSVRRISRAVIRPNGDTQFIKGKIKAQPIDKDGYNLVSLNNKTYRAHRIIAKTWIPIIDNKGQINHKNGNKQDNRADNLEWVSCKDNIRHFLKVLKGKPVQVTKTNSSSNPRVRKVLNLDTGEVYESMSHAAKAVGASVSSVSDQLKGRYLKSYKIQSRLVYYTDELAQQILKGGK